MMHWFSSKKKYPAFFQDYIDLIADEGFSKDLIAFDMETNGLNPKTSEILSFGSIPIVDGKIKSSEEIHLFFNGTSVESDSIVIHELFAHTSDQVAEEYLPLILKAIGNKTILGHFVQFDIALINQLLKKLNLPKLKNPSVDTLKLALKKDGINDYNYAKREEYTLYALCTRYGIEVEFVHDALADAYLTALVYLHMR